MYGIVVHGGAGGTSSSTERECREAARLGMEVLRRRGSALDAAVTAVKHMEDTGIFNAGPGAILRMDGTTIEMDAVVAMSADGPQGIQGAVGAVRNVKNPVLLAYEVTKTPHLMLTGEGAEAFARQRSLEEHPGPSRRVQKRFESLQRVIVEGRIEAAAPGWTSEDLERLWRNSDGAAQELIGHSDTVGAVTLDVDGRFGLASSTGGSSLMLPGRVGDVPNRGAGWQLGPLGGVLATGIGEEIIRQEGSRKVYTLIDNGFPVQQACESVTSLFPRRIPVGFIAFTKNGAGVATNSAMASHSITESEPPPP